ncbi:MAG: cell division protein FtsA [Sphingomonadales bacterium]
MALKDTNGKPLNGGRLVAALDVGTSKVACLIGRVDDHGRLVVKGMGHRVSRGVRGGVILDMDQASSAICAALDQAEQVAGQTIEDVIVNLSAGSPRSQILDATVPLNGHGVQQSHIDQALGKVSDRIDLGKNTLVHIFPACYSLDGTLGVNEPLGMFGENLSVTLHAVVASSGPLRNLETCIQRAHLEVSRVVLSPYASGLATLVEDEKELGAACIDMGGGTTTLSLFVRGRMVHAEVLPMGGDQITQSIAAGLLTPINQAERLKILNGCAYYTKSDEAEIIEIPKLGNAEEGERTQIPRSVLTMAIEPHMQNLFGTIARRFKACGFEGSKANRVVLTGGASQLTGVRAYAENVLGKEVRLGRPIDIDGLPEAARAASFATLVGLFKYVVQAPLEVGEARIPRFSPAGEAGKWSRLSHWLRENF